jgi:glycosyltransferase involved in cell wall biosynthesis
VTISAIHQFVPTFERSAVGDHIVQVREVVRSLGLRSEIFAQVVRPDLADVGRQVDDYARAVKPQPGDVLMYHMAQGGALADVVARRPERLIVDHHNITPARFFTAWEPDIVANVLWGRRQLAALAGRAELGIADSSFNASELLDAGYRSATVVPILVDTSTFDRAVDRAALERLRADGPVWLFVGRIVPNKAQHDLVKALAVHHRMYGPGARLRLVGSTGSARYGEAVRRYAADLGLQDWVEIHDQVFSDGELAAHYRAADVMVCVSEHEGFWVPALEAMHHELPVVAFASTAVPETLGTGGLLLPSKSPAVVAEAAHRAVTDERLRRAMIAAGAAQLARFSLAAGRQRLVDALAPVLS